MFDAFKRLLELGKDEGLDEFQAPMNARRIFRKPVEDEDRYSLGNLRSIYSPYDEF